jgi:hypothetical protein
MPVVTSQEAFVTRLRRHRERNGISLDDIAAETRIKWELLVAFEQNDLSAWPRGVYARAWIRAYASAIGFDPIDTVDEFCRLFPHGDRRAGATITEIASIVAAPSEYRDEFPQLVEGDRRRAAGTRINVMAKPTLRDHVLRFVRMARTVRIVPVRVVRTLLRTTRMY